MDNKSNEKFTRLRNDYPLFIYEGFDYSRLNNRIDVQFYFTLVNKTDFKPTLSFFLPHENIYEKLSEETISNAIFNIGMVEMISYWKACCSPKILIKPYKLNKEQEMFWKKLFFLGLGEFFHTNNINTNKDDLLIFEYESDADNTSLCRHPELSNSYIIPVGGGKDSAVSIELLKSDFANTTALVVNQREATRSVLKAGGFNSSEVFEISRKLDPSIIKLNEEGFLNGHTPFSALLAFVSSFAAIVAGKGNITLSNESSANEASIPGTEINHQYSKSFEFEKDFREYYTKFISPSVNYFSLLRPLNELQIGGLFAKYYKYHNVFKSCNAGSKKDTWCCNCPKCLFTYIILSPFLSSEQLIEIFGENLYDKTDLTSYFDQLCGFAEEKPFECVGTIDEVNAAVACVIEKAENKLPYLLNRYKKLSTKHLQSTTGVNSLLSVFNDEHFLSADLADLVKSNISGLRI